MIENLVSRFVYYWNVFIDSIIKLIESVRDFIPELLAMAGVGFIVFIIYSIIDDDTFLR